MEFDKLLLDVLPVTFRWKKWVDILDSQTYWENFKLNDAKACKNCINIGKQCKELTVANFIVENTVVLSYQLEDFWDEYAKHYKKAQGSVCDYIHIDISYNKFVLNELTCTKEVYVNPFVNTKGQQDGKREKARKQMNSVVSLLNEVNEIENYISTFGEKIGLFSWRIPSDDSNVAEKAMGMFMQPQKAVGDITVLTGLNHGFKFVQQLYPATFKFG